MAEIHDYTKIDVWNLPLAQEKLGITPGIPFTRRINTTAPLFGGGDLSEDLTFSLLAASATQSGYLSAADFALFSSKQPALLFSGPLIKTGSTISMPAATALVDGYLSAADFAAFAASSGPPDSLEVSIVAAENLPAYGPVTSLGLKADSANPSASFGRVIGLAPAAIANGFSGPVVEIGEVTNAAWTWTPGDYIFLSGTSLATTPPGAGFVQRLGTAKNPTTIIVDIADAVLL